MLRTRISPEPKFAGGRPTANHSTTAACIPAGRLDSLPSTVARLTWSVRIHAVLRELATVPPCHGSLSRLYVQTADRQLLIINRSAIHRTMSSDLPPQSNASTRRHTDGGLDFCSARRKDATHRVCTLISRRQALQGSCPFEPPKDYFY